MPSSPWYKSLEQYPHYNQVDAEALRLFRDTGVDASEVPIASTNGRRRPNHGAFGDKALAKKGHLVLTTSGLYFVGLRGSREFFGLTTHTLPDQKMSAHTGGVWAGGDARFFSDRTLAKHLREFLELSNAVTERARLSVRVTMDQPPAPNVDDSVDHIAKLAQLKDQGHITQAEFDAKKAELLNRI